VSAEPSENILQCSFLDLQLEERIDLRLDVSQFDWWVRPGESASDFEGEPEDSAKAAICDEVAAEISYSELRSDYDNDISYAYWWSEEQKATEELEEILDFEPTFYDVGFDYWGSYERYEKQFKGGGAIRVEIRRGPYYGYDQYWRRPGPYYYGK
jgi:hypothetical protein